MNFLRSQSDMESGRIRTTSPRQPPMTNIEANRNQIFARTPMVTKEMLQKLQNAELKVPTHAQLCGFVCNTRQISVLLALMILFVLSSSLAFVFWQTAIFRTLVLQELVISSASPTYNNFVHPSPSQVRMYVYNYTNIEEVATGREPKLRVQELGPFTYEDRLTRRNIVFSDDATTVSYQVEHAYNYLPEASNGNMQNAKVTVPNIPLLTGAAMFRRSYFLTRLTMSTVFKQLNAQPFSTVSADRLFMGYDDELFSLAKGMMGKPYPFDKFGLLATRSGISPDVFEVYTGKNDISRIGTVKSVNGRETLDHWSNEQCDNVHGVDGVLFSPHAVQHKANLELLYKEICRRVTVEFKEETRILNGSIPAYRYVMPENAFGHPAVNNPMNQGYCALDGDCPPHGTVNVTKCAFGTPMYISMPHFMGADPRLREQVEGISPPRADLHQTFIDYHPFMGFMMQGWNRVQTNIQVQKSFGFDQLGIFEDDAILPVAWMEFGAAAESQPDYILKIFHDATYLVDGIDLAFRFGSILMMAVTFLGVCCVLRRNRHDNKIHSESMESIS